MPLNLNQLNIAGNLTREIELRYTPKGTALAKGALAINRKWTTDDGEKREDVTFVDFTVWGNQAEACGKHCFKGQNVMICGRLVLESWDDKATGQKRQKLSVVAEQVHFITWKEPGAAAPAPAQRRQQAPAQEPAQPPSDGDDLDVPF